jgi:hypothetical protein
MSNWKKVPDSTWLLDSNSYRIKEKPVGESKCEGPWYSEYGEDGILTYLFEYINDEHKFAVDIGAAHGYGGSNIRHLADKYNWETTEFEDKPRRGKWPRVHPSVKELRASPKNICKSLLEHNTPFEFDLLSLDIDSMDWYVLKAMLDGGFKPNVIILEYNPIFDHDEEIVRNFDMNYGKDSSSGYGASLSAFEKLLNKHNHTLVVNCADIHNEIYSNNAIFLNNKFIRDNDKIQTIEELHPNVWKEPWKTKNIEKDLTKLKKYLIEHSVMKELKDEDYND